MDKKIIRVETKDRLPTKNGLYNVEPWKHQIHFIAGHEKCKKEWLNRISVWHEEHNDYSKEFLELLNEMYNDLEIPKHYHKKIKILLIKAKQ